MPDDSNSPADDENDLEVQPESPEVGEPVDGADPTEPATATGDDDGADETGAESDVEIEHTKSTLRSLNRNMVGELVMHFPSRDVTVRLDGDAALRVLTMYSRRREGRWADFLHPEASSAFAGWLVLDLEEPMAMSWRPGVPTPGRRTAVDPTV